MNANPKRDIALTLLSKTGIWRCSYEPPLLRLLWNVGFDVPPPHFVSFWQIALSWALWFGVFWGLFMWLLEWSDWRLSLALGLIYSALAGIFFGFSMASYYAYGRRKHKLPPWESLGVSSLGD